MLYKYIHKKGKYRFKDSTFAFLTPAYGLILHLIVENEMEIYFERLNSHIYN